MHPRARTGSLFDRCVYCGRGHDRRAACRPHLVTIPPPAEPDVSHAGVGTIVADASHRNAEARSAKPSVR